MGEEEGVIEQQFYSLRWRSHLSNLMNNLQQYLEQSFLTDVTLACDGETFKAHQAVLSICSPYFESMFVGHPCPHPIVFMMGVNKSEIKAILQFLYSGSVTVSQSCLPNFLKVAEALQIRGLMSDEPEYGETEMKDDKIEHQNESEKDSECLHNEEVVKKEKLADNPDDEDSDKSNGDTGKTGEDNEKRDSSSNQNQQPCSSLKSCGVSSIKSGEIPHVNSSSKSDVLMKTSKETEREMSNNRKYSKGGTSSSSSSTNSTNNNMEVDSDSATDECYTVGYYLDAVSLLEKPEDGLNDLEQDGSSNEILESEDGLASRSLFEKVEGIPQLKRCKLCGKLVRGRKHRFVHMPGSFTCPYCCCVYTRSDNLNAHMKSKHTNPSLKLPATPTSSLTSSGEGLNSPPAILYGSSPNSPNSIEKHHAITKNFLTDCIWPVSS